MLKSIIASLLFCCLSAQVIAQPKQEPTTTSPKTVLVTASSETDTTTSATGAATAVGRVAVGTAGAKTSTYEHSEVWEVVRRFNEECSSAIFVTNPETPHTLTIHVDYERINGGFMMGNVAIYQLVLLDHANNPLYVSKKNWLRREIKPLCQVIQRQ